MMGDDDLSFFQKLVGDAHALIEQATRVSAKIEDETLQFAKFIESLLDFVLGGFIEAANMHVADAGTDFKLQIDAEAWNFSPNHIEFQWFLRAFSEDGDVDVSTFGAFEQVGDFAGIPATGREVRVPICVAYDVEDDRITRARIYLLANVLMQQLGAIPESAHVG